MKAAKLFGILGAAMMITSMVTMVPAEEDLSGRDEMSTGSLEFRVIGEDGNNELYHIENVESLGENSLTGKRQTDSAWPIISQNGTVQTA